MVERTNQASLSIHFQIPGGPGDRRADVTGEDGVFVRELADDTAYVLRVDDLAVGTALRQRVEVSPRPVIVSQSFVEMGRVLFLLNPREQRSHGVADRTDNAKIK